MIQEPPPYPKFEIEWYEDLTGDHRCTYGKLKEMLTWFLKQHVIYVPDSRIEIDTVFNHLDYLSVSAQAELTIIQTTEKEIPQFRWLYNYAVIGSNEGHYFHIAILTKLGRIENLITAKTLSDNTELASQINYYITKFVLTYMR